MIVFGQDELERETKQAKQHTDIRQTEKCRDERGHSRWEIHHQEKKRVPRDGKGKMILSAKLHVRHCIIAVLACQVV